MLPVLPVIIRLVNAKDEEQNDAADVGAGIQNADARYVTVHSADVSLSELVAQVTLQLKYLVAVSPVKE